VESQDVVHSTFQQASPYLRTLEFPQNTHVAPTASSRSMSCSMLS
jgi:hypothetical protein